MRSKLAVGVGLIVVALTIVGPPFMVLSLRPYKAPLRIGMEAEEVENLLGEPTFGKFNIKGTTVWYKGEPDLLGNQREGWVYFDHKERVTGWDITPLPRTRPPWLVKAMKTVGW